MGSMEVVGGDQPEKWEGKVSAKLPTATADAAWSLLSSFSGIHRWFPGLSCRTVRGVDGQPGCVRYCSTGGNGDDDDGGDAPKKWCNEELLSYDAAERSYSYTIGENNMGFGYYVATFKVAPEEEGLGGGGGDGGGGGGGSRIEWSFVSEPVQGWSFDGLAAHLQKLAEGMAARVEEASKEEEKEEEEEEGGAAKSAVAAPDAMAVATE